MSDCNAGRAHISALACCGRALLAALLAIGVILPARSIAAQQTPASMPMGAAMAGLDMSHAPADIQAIWKKLMTGGMPSGTDAQRLGAWMKANKGAIQQSAMHSAAAQMNAMPAAQAAGGVRLGGAAEAQCPARSPALATLATAAPSAQAAAALLDAIHAQYAAIEQPTTVHALEHALAGQSVAHMRQAGGMLLIGGYDAATVLAYVSAIHHASLAERPGVWGDLGAALVTLGDARNAVPVLRYALSLGPRSALIVHNLGIAYADLGDLPSAATLLTEVTHTSPSFGGAYDALARVESCAGNMGAAWLAAGQAQQADWTPDREEALEEHARSTSSKDGNSTSTDAANASTPLPEPPGASPFQTTSGDAGASSFDAATPALPDAWREAAEHAAYFKATYAAYLHMWQSSAAAGAAGAAAAAAGGPGAARARAQAAEASRPAMQGIAIIVPLSNDDHALKGAYAAQQRTETKIGQMDQAFGARLMDNLTPAARAAPQSCSAKIALLSQLYTSNRDAARVYIGGLSGIAGTFNAAMTRWFAWAGDPKARRMIDHDRIVVLTEIESAEFKAAALATAVTVPKDSVGQPCTDRPGDATGPAATALASNDAGKCAKKAIHLFVASLDMDCEELTIELKPGVLFDEIPSGKIAIHSASATHNGTVFMGFSEDAAPGDVLEAHLGVGLTFDQSGLVTGAGPAGGISVGNQAYTGTASATGMLNILQGNTPAFSGSAGTEAPGWTEFAGSPSFAGKM